MTFRDGLTLGEARAQLRRLVRDGHECPLCRQYAKVYSRQVHAGMAASLIRFYVEAGTDWFHRPSIDLRLKRRSRDEAMLAYWSLVEEERSRREDGGRAGIWRVTQKGEAFVRVWATIPQYADVYDGRVLGVHGEPRSILDCLGTQFDYAALMRS